MIYAEHDKKTNSFDPQPLANRLRKVCCKNCRFNLDRVKRRTLKDLRKDLVHRSQTKEEENLAWFILGLDRN